MARLVSQYSTTFRAILDTLASCTGSNPFTGRLTRVQARLCTKLRPRYNVGYAKSQSLVQTRCSIPFQRTFYSPKRSRKTNISAGCSDCLFNISYYLQAISDRVLFTSDIFRSDSD